MAKGVEPWPAEVPNRVVDRYVGGLRGQEVAERPEERADHLVRGIIGFGDQGEVRLEVLQPGAERGVAWVSLSVSAS